MTMSTPTTALVLETNNLRGGDGKDRVIRSLARLLMHLRAQQTRSPSTLDEVVITHDGLDAAARQMLAEALGRPVQFVEIAPDTGYYEAKNRGFDATSADVVAFADADCHPDPVWLERLLAPFANPAVRVVSGRTTYRDDVLGAAASAIDFLYFTSPLERKFESRNDRRHAGTVNRVNGSPTLRGGAFAQGLTRNFYANNVAFRREVFARFRYQPAEGIYRGHCQRLGLALAAAEIPVHFVPEARTIHRFPDHPRELVRLRLLRGADTTEMAPSFANALLPRPLRWIGRTGPLAPLAVLGVRFGFSQRAIGRQDLGELRGLRRAAARGAIAAISALDAAGAMSKSLLHKDFGVHDGALGKDALSYHHDGDGLNRAAA